MLYVLVGLYIVCFLVNDRYLCFFCGWVVDVFGFYSVEVEVDWLVG